MKNSFIRKRVRLLSALERREADLDKYLLMIANTEDKAKVSYFNHKIRVAQDDIANIKAKM